MRGGSGSPLPVLGAAPNGIWGPAVWDPPREHLLSPVPAAAGQFLWEVDAGLAAERAGMREGDRVLAVNGESIEGLDHQQTVLRIRAHEDWVTLLVIDPASDEFYRSVRLGDPRGAGRARLWGGSQPQTCVGRSL